jgi:RNA polymerase sigma-70 factor (ECF subfamily)
MKSQADAKVVIADMILVKRVQQGEIKAFNLLVAKYQRRIHAIVARYVSDPQEQLDLIQEVFFKAFRGLENFRGESQFFTWLYRITCNTAKNYIIARDRRPPDHDIDASLIDGFGVEGLEELASPEHIMLRDEIERTVFNAISALPNDMQDAIVMREIEGLTYEAIAQQMDCPVGTVRSRIFRAREMIDQSVRPLLLE